MSHSIKNYEVTSYSIIIIPHYQDIMDNSRLSRISSVITGGLPSIVTSNNISQDTKLVNILNLIKLQQKPLFIPSNHQPNLGKSLLLTLLVLSQKVKDIMLSSPLSTGSPKQLNLSLPTLNLTLRVLQEFSKIE